jgi:hypothetical protein
MPQNDSQAHHTFSRRVAPFAPLALALLMNASPAASPGQTKHRAGPIAGSFVPACMPFNGQKIPAIDEHCGVLGGSSDPSKQAQSKAKNNLCAATGPSQPITYQELLDLQAKASSENVKGLPDRSPLTQLGEGRYVEYVAFIEDAHYSDVAKGEAVNCNIPGDTTNDIHIVLVQHASDDPCSSTTAEMIPHYRPSGWTDKNLSAIKQHPVKVRGPLFFDDSHTPCTATSRPNPKRASLWEIHPVYSLQVCRLLDLDQCRNSTNASDWVALEDWSSDPNADQ